MTEKEIKDVQKAMEQCLNRSGYKGCKDCPLLSRTELSCYKYIYKTVLTYMEGQQKAIKTLKEKLIKATEKEEVKPTPLYMNNCDLYPRLVGSMCNKCRSVINESFKYCPYCGGKIKWK